MGRETAILAEVRLFCCVREGIGEEDVWFCAMKLRTKCKCRLTLKADLHLACRSHAVLLPFSDCSLSFVNVRVLAGNIRIASPTFYKSSFLQCAATTLFLVHDKRCLVSHWPPASEIGMLLVRVFGELHVVAGRSPTRADSPQAVSRRPYRGLAL